MKTHISSGDKVEAAMIMREAAQWLMDSDRPMWDIDDFTPDNLANSPDEFYVLWGENESIAAMTLTFEDKVFWPQIPPNSSGFIHKLSVRRKYAGNGYAEMMIEHAKKVCLAKRINYLRLDCQSHREGLLKLYNSCGFTLVEMKQVNIEKLGLIDSAMFEMKLD